MSTARLVVAALLISALSACGKKAHVQKASSKVRQNASARAAAVPRPPPPPPPPPQASDGTYSVGGLRYYELLTGGGQPNETLPLVVFMHGHGQSPEPFAKKLTGLQSRARVVVLFGIHPGEKTGFAWFPGGAQHTGSEAMFAHAIPQTEPRVASGIAAIAKARPTIGKPVLSGFSQGGGLTYALVLRHPEQFSYACSMAGILPPQVFQGATPPPGPKPEVHGFIGSRDPGHTPRDDGHTIKGLRRLGYSADLHVIPGIAHDFNGAERDVFACIDRAVGMVASQAQQPPPPQSPPSQPPQSQR